MSHGRSAFLLGLRIGWHRCGRVGLFVTLLRIGRKLVLPFQLQFQFGVRQLLLKAFVFRHQPGDRFPFGINGSEKVLTRLLRLIGQLNQRTERCAAQMGTMAHVGAVVFVCRVKAK